MHRAWLDKVPWVSLHQLVWIAWLVRSLPLQGPPAALLVPLIPMPLLLQVHAYPVAEAKLVLRGLKIAFVHLVKNSTQGHVLIVHLVRIKTS